MDGGDGDGPPAAETAPELAAEEQLLAVQAENLLLKEQMAKQAQAIEAANQASTAAATMPTLGHQQGALLDVLRAATTPKLTQAAIEINLDEIEVSLRADSILSLLDILRSSHLGLVLIAYIHKKLGIDPTSTDGISSLDDDEEWGVDSDTSVLENISKCDTYRQLETAYPGITDLDTATFTALRRSAVGDFADAHLGGIRSQRQRFSFGICKLFDAAGGALLEIKYKAILALLDISEISDATSFQVLMLSKFQDVHRSKITTKELMLIVAMRGISTVDRATGAAASTEILNAVKANKIDAIVLDDFVARYKTLLAALNPDGEGDTLVMYGGTRSANTDVDRWLQLCSRCARKGHKEGDCHAEWKFLDNGVKVVLPRDLSRPQPASQHSIWQADGNVVRAYRMCAGAPDQSQFNTADVQVNFAGGGGAIAMTKAQAATAKAHAASNIRIEKLLIRMENKSNDDAYSQDSTTTKLMTKKLMCIVHKAYSLQSSASPSAQQHVDVLLTQAESLAGITPAKAVVFDTGSAEHIVHPDHAGAVDSRKGMNIGGIGGKAFKCQGSALWPLQGRSNTGKIVDIPATDAQVTPYARRSIASVGKLAAQKYKFHIDLDAGQCEMITPTHDVIPLCFDTQDILVLPDLDSAIQNATFLVSSQRAFSRAMVTAYMHSVLSHESNCNVIRDTLRNRTGDVFNGQRIHPEHILDHIECRACAMAKIQQKRLKGKGRSKPLPTLHAAPVLNTTSVPQLNEEYCDKQFSESLIDDSYMPTTDAVEIGYTAVIPGKPQKFNADVFSTARHQHLRPGEAIYLDSKPYDTRNGGQSGGFKYCLVVKCAATDRVAVVDHKTKDAVGIALRRIIVRWGLHKLPYKVTAYHDGCGSMVHVGSMCHRFGIDSCYVPPDLQSTNAAETEIKKLFDAGATTLEANHERIPTKYLRYIIKAIVVQNNLRSSNAAALTPMERWTGVKPDVGGGLSEVGTIFAVRNTRTKANQKVKTAAASLRIGADGSLVRTKNEHVTNRGSSAMFLCYTDERNIRDKRFLIMHNTGRHSLIRSRSYGVLQRPSAVDPFNPLPPPAHPHQQQPRRFKQTKQQQHIQTKHKPQSQHTHKQPQHQQHRQRQKHQHHQYQQQHSTKQHVPPSTPAATTAPPSPPGSVSDQQDVVEQDLQHDDGAEQTPPLSPAVASTQDVSGVNSGQFEYKLGNKVSAKPKTYVDKFFPGIIAAIKRTGRRQYDRVRVFWPEDRTAEWFYRNRFDVSPEDIYVPVSPRLATPSSTTTPIGTPLPSIPETPDTPVTPPPPPLDGNFPGFDDGRVTPDAPSLHSFVKKHISLVTTMDKRTDVSKSIFHLTHNDEAFTTADKLKVQQLLDTTSNVHSNRKLASSFLANRRVHGKDNDNDMSWPAAMRGEHASKATAAFDKEMDSLERNGFTLVLPHERRYKQALAKAKIGRLILSKKRADIHNMQRWKCRAVEQGHKTKSPASVNLFSPVTGLEEVRALALSPNRNAPHPLGPRTLSKVDVVTAYLQGDDFPADHEPSFHKFRSPTGEWVVRYERCPLYGSDVAARHWYSSLRKQLLSQGFEQGFSTSTTSTAKTLNEEYLRAPAANCPCMFRHPITLVVLLIYVDDIIVDGRATHVDDFYVHLQRRFKVTPPEFLTHATPIDFNGIILSMTDEMIMMDMQPYIMKALESFGMSDIEPSDVKYSGRLPMLHTIDDKNLLGPDDAADFLSKVGVTHWLGSTVSPSTKFTVNRCASYMANPTVGALRAVNDLLLYHKEHAHYGLGIPLIDETVGTGHDAWAIYCDSDNSNNAEINNKRRGQYGYVVGYRTSKDTITRLANKGINASPITPIMANAKTTGIAFATPDIGEHHVGNGSGENEIYGMANSIDATLKFSYMVDEMGVSFPLPFRMITDATTAKAFAMGTAQRSRLHHIDKRQTWVSICRDKRVCEVDQRPGITNAADIMTKYYFNHPCVFERQRAMLQIEVPANLFST